MNPTEWTNPTTVAEAVASLSAGGTAKAGGVDLADLMKEGIASPRRLVNLRTVRGLAGSATAGDTMPVLDGTVPAIPQTFDASSSSVVNTTNNTITFASAHGFATGDQVVYQDAGGTAIDGLKDNRVYFVIRVDDDTIKPGLAMILDAHGEVLVESHALDDDVVVGLLDPSTLAQASGRRGLLDSSYGVVEARAFRSGARAGR